MEITKKWQLPIIIVFQWQDHHLHEFTVYSGNNPLARLYCSPEGDDNGDEVLLIPETEKRLTDYIPQSSRIIYAYDFGTGNTRSLRKK